MPTNPAIRGHFPSAYSLYQRMQTFLWIGSFIIHTSPGLCPVLLYSSSQSFPFLSRLGRGEVSKNKSLREFSSKKKKKPTVISTASTARHLDITYFYDIVSFRRNELDSFVLSCSVVSSSFQPHGLKTARLLTPWDFPGRNTGVGCNFLLQGILLTQGLNPRFLHCRWIVYH